VLIALPTILFAIDLVSAERILERLASLTLMTARIDARHRDARAGARDTAS
jgi:hypothetical protein